MSRRNLSADATFNAPEVLRIEPNGKVFVRENGELLFTGLVLPIVPSLIHGQGMEYAFEVMRELALALRATNIELGRITL